jgi:peptidoglycan hydrolase FlgJ
MLSDILSLVEKNMALSRVIESQRTSLDDTTALSGAEDSAGADFSSMLDQAMRDAAKLTGSAAPSIPAVAAPGSTKPVEVASGVKTVDKNSDLYKQCQDFESIFVKQMLDSMNQTIDKSGMLDNGMGQDIFNDMLYDEYAKSMSKTANFGIADTMYRQLSGLSPSTVISR